VHAKLGQHGLDVGPDGRPGYTEPGGHRRRVSSFYEHRQAFPLASGQTRDEPVIAVYPPPRPANGQLARNVDDDLAAQCPLDTRD
jgi:hypothetical protein